MPSQVFIVEDRAIARRTLMRQLERAGRRSVAYCGAAEFLEACSSLPPGILVLDIHMPGKSGLDLLDELPPESGPFAVVILSGSDAVDDAITAFRRGAIHFLRKPYRYAELEAALYEADESLERRMLDLARQADRDCAARLSPRELEVLNGISRGLQSKVIAHELGISIKTVELHRSRIVAKLSAKSISHALSIAHSAGLLAAG